MAANPAHSLSSAAPNASARPRGLEGVELSARDLALAELIAKLAAERAVELLRAGGDTPATGRGLLTAAELAAELNVSRRFVYEHRAELGGEALGGGSRPRLRFD